LNVLHTSQAATDTIEYVATDQSGLTATSTRSVLIEASSRCLFDPLQPKVTLLNLWTAVLALP